LLEKTGSTILGFDVSPDGKILVSSSKSHNLVFVDMKSGLRPEPVPIHVHAALHPKMRVRCLNAKNFEIAPCSPHQSDYLVIGVAVRQPSKDDEASDHESHSEAQGLCLWHIKYDEDAVRDQAVAHHESSAKPANPIFRIVYDIDNPCLPTTTKSAFRDLTRKVGMFDISPDESKIATSIDANERTIVKIWKTSSLLTGGLPYQSSSTSGFGAQFANMSFSPDGKYLAATTIVDWKLYFWPVETTNLVPSESRKPVETSLTLPARGQMLAFNPDLKEHILAIGLQDSNIMLWDTEYHRGLMTIHQHTGGILGLAFSPDGQTLASSGNDGEVRILQAPMDMP
jgi:WD40 repeat protein